MKNLTNYFKEIITVLNKLKMPITWNTPSGLKISYQQIKFASIVVTNKIIKNSKPITITILTVKTDNVKMLRSFMPNFIHSLDASNVHLLLNNIGQDEIKIPVYSVHDCFASTPNNMLLLEKKIKTSFIDIYFKEEGYLLNTHNSIIKQIKDGHGTYFNKDIEYIDTTSLNLDNKEEIALPVFPPGRSI